MAARLLVLLSLLVVTPLAAQDTGYEIRPGDRLTISLFTAAGVEVEVVDGQKTVDRNGDVFLPYIGTVHASGLNETSLRNLLTDRYSTFYDAPVVAVRVELRVSVTGSVGRPGQFFMDPTSTVLDAISTAGGVGPEVAVITQIIPSDQRAVRLVRDGEVLILNLRPDEVETEVMEMRIQSGDWIHVPYRDRSRIRDEITFWGSVVSFLSSAVALVLLVNR
jgi:protein involved in polysaccharide export with SLBB domain